MGLNQLGLGLLFTAKDAATGVMGKVRGGLSQTKDEVGAFKKASKQAFQEFGVGVALMGAGLGAFAVLGSTITEAAAFGKAIALVRTEVDEATFSQESMKDITIDLAKQFGKMPVDEAAALYKAVALGANTAAKSTALMTSANQLAVAGTSDLATTMDALGGTLNAFHMNMSQASTVSDAMFTAMKSGNTTVGDIASAIGRVAPGAYEMGISLQELLGSMAVMTNKGIKASEAVSGLHGALANIVHPSSDAAAEAARLGIKFSAAAVRAKGFTKFMHSITDSARFNKDSLNKLFTSVEGSNAMAMLAGDMANVDATMKAMRTGTGATAAGFEVMTGTLAFQGERFKAVFSALKIRIGEFLEPIAAKGLGILNRLMDAFTNLPGPVQGMIVHIALAAAGLVALLGSVAAGIAAFKIFALAIGTFGGGVLGTLVAALGPAMLVVGALTTAYYAFQYAVENNVGGVASTISRAWGQIKLATEALTQLFTQGGFSGAVRDEFLSGSSTAINFAIQVWLAFTRTKNFISGMVDGFHDAIRGMDSTFAAFGAALDRLLDAFGALSSSTAENGEAFDAAGKSGRSTGKTLAGLADIVVRGATAFIDLAAAIVPVVSGVTGFISKSIGLEGVIYAAKIALVAWTTYTVASAVPALWSMASGGLAAAASIASIVAKLVLANGMNFGSAFSAGAQGLKALVTGAGAALGPIGALTLAVTALYVAFDQWQKLSAAWNDNAGGDMWKKFKNDIGVTSDEEYQRELGITQGNDFDKKQRDRSLAAFDNRPQAVSSPAAISNGAPSAATMPAIASQAQPTASFDTSAVSSVASAAASAAVSKVAPPSYSFIMQVDGEVLGRVSAKSQTSSAAASFNPVSVEE